MSRNDDSPDVIRFPLAQAQWMNHTRSQRTSSPTLRRVRRLLSLSAVAVISAAAALLIPLIPTEDAQEPTPAPATDCDDRTSGRILDEHL